jgi:TatD DNase family protein
MSLTSQRPSLIDTRAHMCDQGFDEDRDAVLERARQAGIGAIIAVGENLTDARKNLELFIELSKELNRPLNIHSRSAGRHAIALLLENNAARVQMHAFDGKAGAALPAVEAGYFFSIPPSVVRSRQKQKLVKRLPLSCLLIETDSPVLGPTPDERNEPANIRQSIKAIAELKDVSEEEVIVAVCENTERLYGNLKVPKMPKQSVQ